MSRVKVMGLTSDYHVCNPLFWYLCTPAVLGNLSLTACICLGEMISYLVSTGHKLCGNVFHGISKVLLPK